MDDRDSLVERLRTRAAGIRDIFRDGDGSYALANGNDADLLDEAASALQPPAADDVEKLWLVWSNEHGAFWGPNECGYYNAIEKAGRYTKAQAEEICRDARPRANSTIHEGTAPEICMPAPEALSTLRSQQSKEIERLRSLEAFAKTVLDETEQPLLRAMARTALARSQENGE